MSESKRRFRLFGVLLRVTFLMGLFAAILLGFGRYYQFQNETVDAVEFPAPGMLIDVNGQTMHVLCEGEGSPTVILDAGQGGWSIDYVNIMEEVRQTTRVCAYDRMGYGWSGPVDDARTPQDISDDLDALVQTGTISGPVVIVGFSYTGLSSRLFANQNENVVGMVLIDPATELDNTILTEDMLKQQQSAVGAFQAFRWAGYFGFLRVFQAELIAPYTPFLSTGDLPEPEIYYTFVTHAQWWDTSLLEFQARMNDEVLNQVAANGAIPNIPTIIIGAETIGQGDAPELEAIGQEHLAILVGMADNASQGEFVLAEGSSHNVLLDRPDLVVTAILDVVSQTTR